MRNIEIKHVKTQSYTHVSTSFKSEMCAYYTRRTSDYKCTFCEGASSRNPSLKNHIKSTKKQHDRRSELFPVTPVIIVIIVRIGQQP